MRSILAAERRSLHVNDRIPGVVFGRDLEAEGVADFHEFQQRVLRLEEAAAARPPEEDGGGHNSASRPCRRARWL